MDYPFGPLAPDQGELTPGAMMVADGVQPLAEGYGPFPGLTVTATATALSGAPRGLISYQTADGTWATVAFTASTAELKASDDTWTSIDSGLSITPGDDWCSLRFGTKLLYTNTTQGLRAYDVEAGGAASAVAAAKDPRWMFECGNLLFGLDCINNVGTRDNRLIRSSAFSDHTNWTTKGADYQPLESGGPLIWGAKISDTTALILQRDGVKLIQVGNVGNALWGILSVSEGFGAVGAKSCIASDGMVFWPSTDGFRMFAGGQVQRIGAGFIDQWFLDRVDQADLSLVQGSIDPFRKNVLWRWKRSGGASDVTFEDVIGYNWQFQRWFTLTVQTSYLGYTSDPAPTWDALASSVTWDTYDYIWDSRFLQGGQPVFGALNGDYKWGSFAGANLAATFTGAVASNKLSGLVNWATPADDSDDGTLELGVKDRLNDDTTWKTGVAKATSGRCALRGRGKVIAFRRNITSGSSWTYAKGIDYVEANTGGPR
jgi:hypothetical protein